MSSKQTDNRIQVKGTSYFTKITVKEEKSLEDRCKVIAVTNQKGGVAKTTNTVDLGVALARLGLKVSLIDSDPQSSLSKSCKVSLDRKHRACILEHDYRFLLRLISSLSKIA